MAKLKRVLVKGVDYGIGYMTKEHRAMVSFECPYCVEPITYISGVQFTMLEINLYEKIALPLELAYCPRCGHKLEWGVARAK